MPEDFYKILGVQKNASQDQIKQAYRDLALKFHPDRNKEKGSEETFKKINEAYAVLGDPEKRRQYDMMGSEAFSRRYSEEDIFRGFNFDNIFREMGININFGFGNEGPFSMFSEDMHEAKDVGQSILYLLTITLQEAATGVDKEVSLKHTVACSRCNGSGGEPGSKRVRCPECAGEGYQRVVRNTILGRMQTVSTCEECRGKGTVFEKRCRDCKGSGGIVSTEKISVGIPKGVMNKMRLRYPGKGDHGRDGNGDLYVEISIKRDDKFTRDEDDLYTQVSVPFYKAILGGIIEAPTLFGTKSIHIDPGTQPGTKITLKQEGMPHINTSRKGDEIIQINVDIPKHLSKEETELISQYQKLDEDKKGPGKRFFGI